MSDDAQLLSDFACDRSEAAFRELVRRHLALVLATARRVLAGDPHLAQDVAQVVFADFARKAAALPADTVPAGWLWRHTRFVAANTARAESRRRQREKTAMHLHALDHDPGLDTRWQRLAPVLDDALATLDPPDRDALVLRYLGDASLRDVGRALGTGEDAAQKRTARALEKLRATLLSRGVTFTGALLTATLEAGAAAPPVSPGLVAAVTRAALAPATGSAFLAMLKTKTFLATAAALIVAVTFVLSSTSTGPTPAMSAVAPPVAPPPAQASAATEQATPFPAPNTAIANALAQLAANQTGSYPQSGGTTPGAMLTFRSTSTLARSAAMTVQNNASQPLGAGMNALSYVAEKTILVPSDLAEQPSRVTFQMVGYLMPPADIAALLFEAYEKAGWAFDPQPDGSLQMRLANTTSSRPSEVFVVIINSVESPTNSPVGSVQIGGGSVALAVSFLISWSTGRGTQATEKQFWGVPVADRVDISPGVWMNRGEIGKVVIKADSIADARRQMTDALRRQAGIVVEILPDHTLRMRLETGDNDPASPVHDFTASSIPDVIQFLNSISGRQYQFRDVLPRVIQPPKPRGGGGPPVISTSDIQELAGRSLTLHVDSGPPSQAIAQVLAALETQAEIIAEEAENPRGVNLRLSATGVSKMHYNVQLDAIGSSELIRGIGTLIGKTIKGPFVWQRGARGDFQVARTVSLNISNATRAEVTQRLLALLKQEFGATLEAQPDGSFTVRWADQQ